eukprot:TRINITY_DN75045_c0_g1_i1.p1 TRINITY_DN75045_c0_g1~~TRINITY_DN75045_c0_g1_i1.p1  ORF type:complete len:675 (+),score=150.00 TRINITY_DN75045_c0_g1_i1:67-2091(+)
MPLAMRSPLSMLRRWSTAGTGDSNGGGGTSSVVTASGQAVPSSRGNRDRAASTRSGSLPSRRASTGPSFYYTVPEGSEPGQSHRVQGPGGREVDIVLPEDCWPGQKILVKVEANDIEHDARGKTRTSSSGGSLNELIEFVEATVEGTRFNISSMRQRLDEEIELQKVLWASAETSDAFVDPFKFDDPLKNRGELRVHDVTANVDLSQTQALVFAAAEVGDCHQLLAALAEARKFSTVTVSLTHAVKNLAEAEEALVTWRCLLDALKAHDEAEMEIWLEHARGLGLQVPISSRDMLSETRSAAKRSQSSSRQNTNSSSDHLARGREIHQKLLFALETDDLEFLVEAVDEAHGAGLGELPAAKEASKRLAHLSEADDGGGSPHPRRGGGDGSTDARTASGGQFGVDPSGVNGSGGGGGSGAFAGEAQEPWTYRPTPSASRAGPNVYSSQSASTDDDDPRSVRELLEECRSLGYNTAGCFDKADLLKLLREGAEKSREAPPGPGGGGCGDSYSSGFFGGFGAGAPGSGPQSAAPPSSGAWHETFFGTGFSFGGFGAPPEPAAPPSAPAPSQTPVSSQAPPRTMVSSSGTVWDRKTPPAHVFSKRNQALHLLGLLQNGSHGLQRVSTSELRSAYKRAAMECHPDKMQNHSRQDEAKELFQRVKAAYDFLQTPAGSMGL